MVLVVPGRRCTEAAVLPSDHHPAVLVPSNCSYIRFLGLLQPERSAFRDGQTLARSHAYPVFVRETRFPLPRPSPHRFLSPIDLSLLPVRAALPFAAMTSEAADAERILRHWEIDKIHPGRYDHTKRERPNQGFLVFDVRALEPQI